MKAMKVRNGVTKAQRARAEALGELAKRELAGDPAALATVAALVRLLAERTVTAKRRR